MGHSVYRNRIEPDFTVNMLETENEDNDLRKRHIDL